ncbi:MAG: sensor histidine kinase [Solirubrobacteraceae bacterium]
MPSGLAAAGWLAASVAVAITIVALRWHAATLESVARVCHELRGPITAARLGLHLGTRGAELTEARIRALDLELARAAVALDDLAAVGDHPRLAGPRGAETPLAWTGRSVDLAGLLADSVEAAQSAAAVRGATLELTVAESPVLVRCDRVRLAQATGNLIANAIEHGGGRIEIRCRLEGDGVRVEVLDGGPGLPASVAALTRRPRGGRGARGRGLAIAAAVAESHGGRLAAAPSERGARLVLELPLAGAARSASPRLG